MGNTYFGRVTVKGLPGTTTYTGTGSVSISDSTILNRSLNFTDDAEVIELNDKGGIMVGAVVTNKKKRVTLEFVPTDTGSSQTEADARTNTVLPSHAVAVGASQVTLTGFCTLVDGVYNYLTGATVGYTSEGLASITMPLVRPEGGPMEIAL